MKILTLALSFYVSFFLVGACLALGIPALAVLFVLFGLGCFAGFMGELHKNRSL